MLGFETPQLWSNLMVKSEMNSEHWVH